MLDFYKDKRVFITGHTGFKGAWLCRLLANAGAVITGYSLSPPTEPSLFDICRIDRDIHSIIGDIRDFDLLKNTFDTAKPEIVLHLAAQPIVRASYKDPRYTYETNVMGTVNILECVRGSDTVRSFLNVTTDKVYQNNEWDYGYREIDPLDGFDPYSNSKSCSELVTHSYKNSFFADGHVAISTARAGNVIGGGDFAPDRIIPDCVRAVQQRNDIIVRNPYSIRPFQHVLEPLYAYLMIAERQFGTGSTIYPLVKGGGSLPDAKDFSGYYNVGPDDCDCVSTGILVQLFCEKYGEGASWKNLAEQDDRHGVDTLSARLDMETSPPPHDIGALPISHGMAASPAPHEANLLKLDCSKLKRTFGWQPRWHIDTAVEKTVEWTKAYLSGGDVSEVMDSQMREYMKTS